MSATGSSVRAAQGFRTAAPTITLVCPRSLLRRLLPRTRGLPLAIGSHTTWFRA
jgi:hypothetical protein